MYTCLALDSICSVTGVEIHVPINCIMIAFKKNIQCTVWYLMKIYFHTVSAVRVCNISRNGKSNLKIQVYFMYFVDIIYHNLFLYAHLCSST